MTLLYRIHLPGVSRKRAVACRPQPSKVRALGWAHAIPTSAWHKPPFPTPKLLPTSFTLHLLTGALTKYRKQAEDGRKTSSCAPAAMERRLSHWIASTSWTSSSSSRTVVHADEKSPAPPSATALRGFRAPEWIRTTDHRLRRPADGDENERLEWPNLVFWTVKL